MVKEKFSSGWQFFKETMKNIHENIKLRLYGGELEGWVRFYTRTTYFDTISFEKYLVELDDGGYYCINERRMFDDNKSLLRRYIKIKFPGHFRPVKYEPDSPPSITFEEFIKMVNSG